MENSTLDVRIIEPRFKHSTIFEKFDLLAPGASLTIVNDHDPKPLYYQMVAERGLVFEWEYLESGPQVWQVKITATGTDAAREVTPEEKRKAEKFDGAESCSI